jgi:hypothetical protein
MAKSIQGRIFFITFLGERTGFTGVLMLVLLVVAIANHLFKLWIVTTVSEALLSMAEADCG